MNEEKYFGNYITGEEFNVAVELIYSPDKECNSLGKELLKNYNILYVGKTYLKMSYTTTMILLETSNGIAGILYINNQKETFGYLKDLYDTGIEWGNKTTDTLESELRELISKPPLTIDKFEKLIPMLISDDKEIVRLGIELFKTYNYENFPHTVLEICICCNISTKEFDYKYNSDIIDNYCSKKLNYAMYKDLFLPF